MSLDPAGKPITHTHTCHPGVRFHSADGNAHDAHPV
ncbi:type VI secretion system contractile sheath small subunit, partial [Xanthomonas perforans]